MIGYGVNVRSVIQYWLLTLSSNCYKLDSASVMNCFGIGSLYMLSNRPISDILLVLLGLIRRTLLAVIFPCGIHG